MIQLVNNTTNVSAFDTFNEFYAPKAVQICPILKKFRINIVSHNITKYAKEAQLCENDAFVYYLKQEKDNDASSVYAEIIVNTDICNKLQLTEQELLAGVAHEVGHIIFYFRTDKDQLHGFEEINSDYYASEMGLLHPLLTLLRKLITSGLYPDELVEQMRQRHYFITGSYES
jgi:hypothetical protein